MATSATPYGARPIGTLSASGSYTGKVQHIKIASAYAVNIFYGDFVKLVATGTIEKDAGTTSFTPVGVFVGCSYTDPNTSQKNTAGSTTIGTSKNAVDISTAVATTATLPLRIIDFVDGPDSSVGDSYTDVIVKYNAGHQYDNTTGI